jgi:hypothetical protein
MAVSIGVLFNPTVLTGSAAVIYTVPSTPSTTTLVNGRVRFTNTTTGPIAVTLYAVPSGGTAGAGNCEMNGESLAANAHVDVDVPLMGAGATIQAFAGTASDITMSALAGVLFS